LDARRRIELRRRHVPLRADKLKKGKNIDFIGVEPAACPTMTRGPYAYDFGDTGQMTHC